jgi:hypothetical protein
MWETQPFDFKIETGKKISANYAKYLVILTKSEWGMELLIHFMLDTNSFVLKHYVIRLKSNPEVFLKQKQLSHSIQSKPSDIFCKHSGIF